MKTPAQDIWWVNKRELLTAVQILSLVVSNKCLSGGFLTTPSLLSLLLDGDRGWGPTQAV